MLRPLTPTSTHNFYSACCWFRVHVARVMLCNPSSSLWPLSLSVPILLLPHLHQTSTTSPIISNRISHSLLYTTSVKTSSPHLPPPPLSHFIYNLFISITHHQHHHFPQSTQSTLIHFDFFCTYPKTETDRGMKNKISFRKLSTLPCLYICYHIWVANNEHWLSPSCNYILYRYT